jgi:hypothetical protein
MLFSSSLFGIIQLLQYTLKHYTSCVQNLTMGKIHLWSQFFFLISSTRRLIVLVENLSGEIFLLVMWDHLTSV